MANAYPIYPSILAFDFARLGEQVAAVEAAGAAGLHFDVMDGHFVPNISFGPLVLQALRPRTKLPFYAHLMIYAPELYIEQTVKAGAARVFVHPEATPHIHRALGMIREAGAEAGVAINPGTPIDILEPLLGMVDGVLIMSVNPGFGGQAFIPSAVGRVAELRALMRKLDVSPAVEVDGGVDYSNIGQLATAGMTGAVVGTALFNGGDLAATLRRLQGLAG
jgi:ribulose-phosphate 3-epimerase